MADNSGRLVVRSHTPKLRAVLQVLAVLLAAALLYAAFEFGRYDAGFRVVEVQPLSLRPDGRLPCPWCFGRLRAYGYLLAVEKRLVVSVARRA